MAAIVQPADTTFIHFPDPNTGEMVKMQVTFEQALEFFIARSKK